MVDSWAPANNKCGNIHLISHSLAWHTLRQPIIKFNDLDSISVLLDPAPSFKLVKTCEGDYNYRTQECGCKFVYFTLTTGRALELQHLRWNTECSVWEELPPIIYNPNYDFDYQQFLYLPREVTILPVSLCVNHYSYMLHVGSMR